MKGIILVYIKIWLPKVFCILCFVIKEKNHKQKTPNKPEDVIVRSFYADWFAFSIFIALCLHRIQDLVYCTAVLLLLSKGCLVRCYGSRRSTMAKCHFMIDHYWYPLFIYAFPHFSCPTVFLALNIYIWICIKRKTLLGISWIIKTYLSWV